MIVTHGLRAGIFSPGIRKVADLEAFFDFEELVWRPAVGSVDVVLTWGNKETGKQAREYAERAAIPLWRLEDGFFRSVGTGGASAPLSLILDDRGIYYDARTPSALEDLLNSETRKFEPELLERAASALQKVKQHRLSKYNDFPPGVIASGNQRPRVLVVDQTFGDASVRDGLANADTFEEMLDWALREFQDAEIVVRTHPEVLRGTKRGYLPLQKLKGKRVTLESAQLPPGDLLQSVNHVVTATSQLGFEALYYGKEVTCFGAPFYSGWGLTEDKVPIDRRRKKRTLEELLAASWLAYPRYIHPLTRKRCELEDVLAHLALQREFYRSNQGKSLAVGFSRWKRPSIRRFFGGPGSSVQFCSEKEVRHRLQVEEIDRVLVWGQKGAKLKPQAEEKGARFGIVEDGFLRSPSLGSDLTPPGSLVVDHEGVYYDSTRSSELETFLSQHEFTESERRRAGSLCESIRHARLSKYNVQKDKRLQLSAPRGQKSILVVGQVDDDASLAFGGEAGASNASLIAEVRRQNPDAFLVYKPHPDVLAGNRRGRLSEAEASLSDHLESELGAIACLEAVDEVHTNTSLVGFEALLRGVPVHTHGTPFYAGWGLTVDARTCSRRRKKLQLSELAYGALIAYPRYFSHRAGCFISPEDMVAELSQSLTEREESIAPTLLRRAKRVSRYLKGRLCER